MEKIISFGGFILGFCVWGVGYFLVPEMWTFQAIGSFMIGWFLVEILKKNKE